ncbi:MAG TPA: alpha/beta hydrolase, partial [Flavobacterium sp.]|nr:alpha/beta hydrolase [Flavobacterium sp.]
RALAPAYVYNKKNAPIIAQRLTEGNSELNGLVWQDLNKMKFDCAPKLANFTKPVLILQGKNDVLDVKIAEKIHKAFKNSELILLDHCGHYGWLDSPEIYFSAIDKFLKNN